jgi:Glycosyl transferase 4-like domain
VSSQPTTGQSRRRLVVVSGFGNNALTPRGQRTQRLVEEFGREWDVDLIAMEDKASSARPGGSSPRRATLRRLAGKLVYKVLLDRPEPWALRRLGRWRPEADAALLIGAPWSPVAHASRRLARAGIPYVVDVGDPWVLTNELRVTSMPLWRARRAERFLWKHAAGAVVTTRAQRDALQEMFPELPIAIRANGYKPISGQVPAPRDVPRDDRRLRLAHFGILSALRIDPVPFLADLQSSGRWESILFAQFGDDFGAGLERVPEGVEVEHHEPRPWSEVIEHALDYDAALVVAYPLVSLLPSKSVEYSTLPLPRIALTNPDPADASREYAATHTGWLALSNGEADVARRVGEHVGRPWSAAELAAPAQDAWPAVAAQVAEFVTACVDGGGSRSAGERG